MAFNFKNIFNKGSEEDYVEIDLNSQETSGENKVVVKPFVLRQFEDINEVLSSLREGYTIAVIDIKPLKTKDVVELKRAVSKIKKTVEAMEGSIAGFGETTIIATPQFAQIDKTPAPQKQEKTDFLH